MKLNPKNTVTRLLMAALLVMTFAACGKKTAPSGVSDAPETNKGEELQISDAEKKKVLAELGVEEPSGGELDPAKRMSEAEKAEAKKRLEARKVQRGDQPPEAGKPAEAAKPAEAPKKAPPPPPTPVAPGKALSGDARQASRACKQCEFYLTENDLNLALQKADAFVQQYPNTAESYLAKAIVLRRQKKLEDAELEVRRALGFDKDHEWAVVYLALLLRDQGRLKPAVWTLEDYRTRYPNSLPTLYSLGILYEIYAGFKAKALVTYVDYLKRGGTKQKEVNIWIDALSIALGVERPETPGMDKPVPPAEPPPAETPPAAPPAGAAGTPPPAPATAPAVPAPAAKPADAAKPAATAPAAPAPAAKPADAPKPAATAPAAPAPAAKPADAAKPAATAPAAPAPAAKQADAAKPAATAPAPAPAAKPVEAPKPAATAPAAPAPAAKPADAPKPAATAPAAPAPVPAPAKK